MIFSSVAFFIFFAVVLLYLSLVKSDRAKKVFLFAASLFFYGYWDYRFVALMLFSIVFDYFVGIKLNEAPSEPARKRLLVASLCVNLGILGFFKYFNFFIETANALVAPFGWHLGALHIILPIGVSFYTFQSMSYAIDVYRRKIEPCRDFLEYGFFVSFFPQLVAGPIVRAVDFLPQVKRKIEITPGNFVIGGQQFLMGMVKKLLIADNLAYYVDFVYGNPSAFNSGTLWLATIAYSIQIFADFSGYTDMAIGVAKCLGFDLCKNFDMPYISRNITEFWRRWHISLSTWLRDYLYISLGGNRVGKFKQYRNLMLTMLLGGLWHGASWNFVIWGALHGLGLVVHKLFAERVKPSGNWLAGVVSWLATYLFVILAWVFFRAQTFADSMAFFRIMFNPAHQGIAYYYQPLLFFIIPVVVIAHLIGMYLENQKAAPRVYRFSFASAFVFAFVLLGLYFFSPLNSSPFVYFQF